MSTYTSFSSSATWPCIQDDTIIEKSDYTACYDKYIRTKLSSLSDAAGMGLRWLFKLANANLDDRDFAFKNMILESYLVSAKLKTGPKYTHAYPNHVAGKTILCTNFFKFLNEL